MSYYSQPIGRGTFFHGDCFEVMRDLPDGSVDMILCDLPYGTTRNSWDTVLPLDQLWAAYWRILKPTGAVVLTAQAPFDKVLGASCLDRLRYEWIWEKHLATGHLNSKRQPMKAHENVLVFYRKQPTYNPQGLTARSTPKLRPGGVGSSNYGIGNIPTVQLFDGYPRSVIKFPSDRGFHPTQKPVALFEYLIRTYTDRGQVVLDNTAGSGTTAIAAENADRRWLCIERDSDYADRAMARIADHVAEKRDTAAHNDNAMLWFAVAV